MFAKYLEICKHFGDNLVNEKGNQPHRGVVPRFSDLEVIALSLTAESIGIDSENNLFAKPIFRIPFSSDEEYFCVDSKPIEVCHISRGKRCKMGRKNFEEAPSFGYCASQGVYYYGYSCTQCVAKVA
jgi:hypothetical protein